MYVAYLHIYLFSFFNVGLKGIIPTTVVVRVAMTGTANTAHNQRSTVESAIKFTSTENLPTHRAQSVCGPSTSREDSTETIV